MLSSHERRVWHEIERSYRGEVAELLPPRPPAPHRGTAAGHPVEDAPAVLVGGASAAILLILLGAPLPGIAVAAATTLAWLLWWRWPRLRGRDARAGVTPAAEDSEALGQDHADRRSPAGRA